MVYCFEDQNNPATIATRKFIELFNKFFDCLNVRNCNEGVRKKNANLYPYRSGDDERLTVRLYLFSKFNAFLLWAYIPD